MSLLYSKEVVFEEAWESLCTGIQHFFANVNAGMSYDEWLRHYTSVYKICAAPADPHADILYWRIKDLLVEHVTRLEERIVSHNSTAVLSAYLGHWNNYSMGMKVLDDVCTYLNRFWITKNMEGTTGAIQGVHKIGILALRVWYGNLFARLRDRLRALLLQMITEEREGKQIDHALLKGVIDTFVALGSGSGSATDVYRNDFETGFLQATADFYGREAVHLAEACTVSEYMQRVIVRLEEEVRRARHYLHSSSEKELRKVCENTLIERQIERIHEEIPRFVQGECVEDLKRVFLLLGRIPNGLAPMHEALRSYVLSVGQDAVRSIDPEEDPLTFVDKLLEVHNRFADLVTRAFENDTDAATALDQACRKFVNFNKRAPELLARTCHVLLEKSNVNVGENELEKKLTDLTLVFRFLDNKDVFQKFYSKFLARRLIQGTSVSDEAEEIMINCLKQACGYDYTTKLTRMFADKHLSTDVNARFHEHLRQFNIDIGIDFSILVLTSGSWPLQQPTTAFDIPFELEKCVKQFQTHYHEKHSGRRLFWLHHVSKGDIRTNYLPRRYELQVTTYQMALLLQFNNADTLGMEDLQSSTQLSKDELRRMMASLLRAKIVLSLPPLPSNGNTVNTPQRFALNYKFSSKRTRIKITAAVQTDSPQESEATHRGVEEDRQIQIQAAIVRVMKTRRQLTHTKLVEQVISQLQSRFQPQIPLIKKCIEQLIEREYIARKADFRDIYVYVA